MNKKIISGLMALTLSLTLSAPAFSVPALASDANGSFENQMPESVEGTSISVSPDASIMIITTEGPTIYLNEGIESRGPTDRQISKTYTHEVVGMETQAVLATVSTKVTAIYSNADRTSQILDVTITSFSGDKAGHSTTYAGNTATLYVYYQGGSIGNILYKITTNGVLSATENW